MRYTLRYLNDIDSIPSTIDIAIPLARKGGGLSVPRTLPFRKRGNAAIVKARSEKNTAIILRFVLRLSGGFSAIAIFRDSKWGCVTMLGH